MVGLLHATSPLSIRSSTASAVVEDGFKYYSKDAVQVTLLYSSRGAEM